MEVLPKQKIGLPFKFALVLAAACGFMSLAYEILWARLFSFASGSLAPGFSAMLGGYLFGLSLGALVSKRWQTRDENPSGSWQTLSRVIVVANVLCFLVPVVASWLILRSSWLRFTPLIVICAAGMGIVLPLLCHLVISADNRAGAKMSYIYLANIIGSGAGSLLTGFVLTDWLRLWQIGSLLIVIAVLISMSLSWFLRIVRPAEYILWGGAVAAASLSPFLHEGVYERLQMKSEYHLGYHLEQIVESRHGVITVTPTNHFVYGNGVYDGVIETRLKPGSMLIRPYFISALHPHPKNVLVIGMSIGSWTQVLANHPQVEKVTVVEIDPGYLKLAARYPEVAGLLKNPKVEIHIDDGRRWLRRNSGEHFDVIVMNTSFYWREFTSALISKEFLEVIKGHLNEGGLAMWNCTGSARAIRTGLEVFPHTMMVANNCVGSVSPLVPNKERWADVLKQYQLEGRPVFDLTQPQGRQDLEQCLTFMESGFGDGCRLANRDQMIQACGSAKIVTDDNLGDEFIPTLGTLFKILLFDPKPQN
jgi:spermidine synthase